MLGNIEFGWKKAGKVTLKVGQEWRTVGQGNSRSRPTRFRVSPCTAFNRPSFEKVKGKDGKASSRIAQGEKQRTAQGR